MEINLLFGEFLDRKLKVYLAAQFKQKEELKPLREELNRKGFICTSSWLDESTKPSSHLNDVEDEYLVRTALLDIEDIRRSDVLVLFTVDPKTPTLRGGRHFETGFACGIGKPVVIVGPKENIFHYLPWGFTQFDHWYQALDYLKKLSRSYYVDEKEAEERKYREQDFCGFTPECPR